MKRFLVTLFIASFALTSGACGEEEGNGSSPNDVPSSGTQNNANSSDDTPSTICNTSECANGFNAYRLEVLNATNEVRSSAQNCGSQGQFPAAAPLSLNPLLNIAAQNHADDMALNDFLSHTGSNGSSMDQRVNDTGYTWGLVGENVAYGYATAESVVNEGWLTSDGHCTNMMQSGFTELGVGKASDSQGRVYWVQVFGTPR